MSWDLAEGDAAAALSKKLEGYKARMKALVKAAAGFDPAAHPVKGLITRTQKEKYGLVIRRTEPTPFQIRKPRTVYPEHIQKMVDEFGEKYAKKLSAAPGVMVAIGYYFDGKRTTAEAARELAFEFGLYAPDAVDAYARIMIALGYAEEVR